MADLNKPEPWDIAIETLGSEQVGWDDKSAIVIRTPVELAEMLDAIAARRAVPAQASAPPLIESAKQHERAFDKACGAFYCEHGRLPAPLEIFAIAAQPAAQASAPDWVSVSDRLPESFVPVLARCKPKRKGGKPLYAVAFYCRTGPQHQAEACWHEPISDEESDVEAWQPIAAPVPAQGEPEATDKPAQYCYCGDSSPR